LKRLFDILFSFFILILLSPIFAIIAIAIKGTSPGSVFYCSKRVGENGRPFNLIKFRSMVDNASQQGPRITHKGDARITRIGQFIRKYKIDELPQFINVLKGEMSIVGPRPEDPAYVALYSPEQLEVLSVKPGITSLASIKYHHEEQILVGENWETIYSNKVMPEKIKIDLEYIKQRSLLTDLYIIFETFFAIFK
jgi:lipopolysaccharide/colanic/teichoic acid biosynthesis glycosyltransferase